MLINEGAKFAAVFFSRCVVGGDLPDDAELVPGVRVARRLGVDLGRHWPSWLGSLTLEEIGEPGLVFYVSAPSKKPDVLNAENEALNQRRDDLLNGLLVRACRRSWKASCSGERT